MSEMGLEPTQISPYAPETYVSTIPPLRHFNSLFNFITLVGCCSAYTLCFLSGRKIPEHFSFSMLARLFLPLRCNKFLNFIVQISIFYLYHKYIKKSTITIKKRPKFRSLFIYLVIYACG